MRRHLKWLAPMCVLAALGLLAALWFAFRGSALDEDQCLQMDRPPRLRPDYAGIVIPPNIAPLTFIVEEPGDRYRVRVSSTHGKPLEVVSSCPNIIIPVAGWRRLLEENRGQELRVEVFTRDAGGQWCAFRPVRNTVAREEIDPYLTYRLIKPLVNSWRHMGIYQRDLESYGRSPILLNRFVARACLNCHTFRSNEPDNMVFQSRSKTAGGMIVARNGSVAKVDTRTKYNASSAAYVSWHPSGKVVAFSANKLTQFMHAAGELREVFDRGSDLGIYMVNSGTATSTKKIASPDRMENWPCWSADGRHLYFCSAPPAPEERYREIKYDLMRIGYDIGKDAWGELETLVAAGDTGLSTAQPRVSPDGRFLIFCMFDYGNFPIFRESSDLYMMDLDTRKYRRLELNSERCDSWHSWSSNSRWLVFSSKRSDGTFARPFFSYMDKEGKAHKPFLLPQKDPTFYDSLVRTYGLPELIKGPVTVSQRTLVQAMYGPTVSVSADTVTGATTPMYTPAEEPAPNEPAPGGDKSK